MAEEQLDEQVEDGQEEALTSQADPKVQAEAKRMGWIPPDRYKGDPEKFVDADVFVKRGEEVLPIIKHQKSQLESKVAKLAEENAHLVEVVKKNEEAMKALERYHTGETKRKVEQVRKELKAAYAKASEAGDHEAMAEVTDQMTQLNAKVDETAEDEEETPKSRTPAPKSNGLDPEFIEWAEDTGWYGKDRRRTALANAVAAELRQGGEEATGREFLDLVREEVENTMPLGRRPNPNKANGGSARGGAAGGGGGRKGYESLPADARAACDSYNNELVGEGRRYKTTAEWRAAYAKQYYEDA